jgi:hypothetical protein
MDVSLASSAPTVVDLTEVTTVAVDRAAVELVATERTEHGAARPQTEGRRVDHRPRVDALVGRHLDPWLLGGASIAALLVIAGLEQLRDVLPSAGGHLDQVAALAAFGSLAVNYPHFMASYTVAYGRGRSYVARHYVALVAVPVVLSIVLLTALATLGDTLRLGGVEVTDTGEHILGWATQLMFLTVGWHYAKQAYGCARAGAHLRGYDFTSAQTTWLRVGLAPLWVSLFVASNAGGGDLSYFGLTYPALGLPHWTTGVAHLALAAGALVVIGAFAASARANRRYPPLVAIVPVVAIFVWWVPVLRNPTFLLLVPFFHSLQYLPFAATVHRHRHSERRAADQRSWPLGLLALAAVVVGWLVFEAIPGATDHAQEATRSAAVVAIAVTVFVNVHHYCIDHVAWRLREPIARHELFAPAAEPPRP